MSKKDIWPRRQQRFVDRVRQFGIDRLVAERALDLSRHGEGPRDTVREQLLARQAAAAEDTPDIVAAFVFMMAHASPSGDYTRVRKALDAIDPAWRTSRGCDATVRSLATCIVEPGLDDLRIRAISVLADVASASSVEALLSLADFDLSVSVRVEAAAALIPVAPSLRNHPRARSILEEVVRNREHDDRAPNLRRYAEDVLQRMSEAPQESAGPSGPAISAPDAPGDGHPDEE